MSADVIIDGNIEQSKQLVRVLYLIHLVCFILSLGTISIIPLIINYLRRPDTVGTIAYSHHTWMIRTFWTYFGLMILAGVLFITIIGIPLAWLIGCGAWLWYIYRCVRGLMDLNTGRPMPV